LRVQIAAPQTPALVSAFAQNRMRPLCRRERLATPSRIGRNDRPLFRKPSGIPRPFALSASTTILHYPKAPALRAHRTASSPARTTPSMPAPPRYIPNLPSRTECVRTIPQPAHIASLLDYTRNVEPGVYPPMTMLWAAFPAPSKSNQPLRRPDRPAAYRGLALVICPRENPVDPQLHAPPCHPVALPHQTLGYPSSSA
jgi:hypothetical protein